MKIVFFFLEGNENCRVITKKTVSVELVETQVFFFRLYLVANPEYRFSFDEAHIRRCRNLSFLCVHIFFQDFL